MIRVAQLLRGVCLQTSTIFKFLLAPHNASRKKEKHLKSSTLTETWGRNAKTGGEERCRTHTLCLNVYWWATLHYKYIKFKKVLIKRNYSDVITSSSHGCLFSISINTKCQGASQSKKHPSNWQRLSKNKSTTRPWSPINIHSPCTTKNLFFFSFFWESIVNTKGDLSNEKNRSVGNW